MQPTWPRWSSVSIHDPKRTTLGWSWEKAALASTPSLSFCARETISAGLCLYSNPTHLLWTPSQSVPRASPNQTKIMTGTCPPSLGFEVEFPNSNLSPRQLGNSDLGCTPLTKVIFRQLQTKRYRGEPVPRSVSCSGICLLTPTGELPVFSSWHVYWEILKQSKTMASAYNIKATGNSFGCSLQQMCNKRSCDRLIWFGGTVLSAN